MWRRIFYNEFALFVSIFDAYICHLNIWIRLWHGEVAKKHAPYQRLSAISTNNYCTLFKRAIVEAGANAIICIFDISELSIILAAG